MADSSFSSTVMEQLRARAAGHCEGCGRWAAHLEAHHRKFRSRGGEGTVENGAMLCGWGNHTGCHGAAHGQQDPHFEAGEYGWAVSRGDDPAEVPFIDRRGEIWMFHKDGTKTRLGEPEPTADDPWATPFVAEDPWAA